MKRTLPLLLVLVVGCVYEATQESSAPVTSSRTSEASSTPAPSGEATTTPAVGSSTDEPTVAEMRAERQELTEMKDLLRQKARSGDTLSEAEVNAIMTKIESAEKRIQDIERRLEKLEH